MTDSTPKGSKSTAKAAGTSNGAAANDFFAKSQKAAEDWFRAGAEAWTGNFGAWKSLNAESTTGFGDWDEVAEQGRENFDAWVASSTIAAEGILVGFGEPVHITVERGDHFAVGLVDLHASVPPVGHVDVTVAINSDRARVVEVSAGLVG